jgi:hypothetical protein
VKVRGRLRRSCLWAGPLYAAGGRPSRLGGSLLLWLGRTQLQRAIIIEFVDYRGSEDLGGREDNLSPFPALPYTARPYRCPVFFLIKKEYWTRILPARRRRAVRRTVDSALCHNICCLIQSVYELNLKPKFWKEVARRLCCKNRPWATILLRLSYHPPGIIPLKQHKSPFKWRHFEPTVILLCVRWYCRYQLSYRDLEEMMRERGLSVDHTSPRGTPSNSCSARNAMFPRQNASSGS